MGKDPLKEELDKQSDRRTTAAMLGREYKKGAALDFL